MSLHKILRGDGAGKYLPFARNHLADLRKHMSIHAYQNTVRVADANIRVSWAGDEEHINIAVDSGRIVAHSRSDGERDFNQTPYHPGLAKKDFFYALPDFVTPFDVALMPFFLGAHETFFILAKDKPASAPNIRIATVYRSRDGHDFGNTAALVHTYDTQLAGEAFIPLNTDQEAVYAGVVRDGDGVVTGKRFVIKTGLIAAGDVGIAQTSTTLEITSDSGDTWETVNLLNPFPSGDLWEEVFYYSLAFVGNDTLLMACSVRKTEPDPPPFGTFISRTRTIRSTDGGFTWAPVPTAIDDSLPGTTAFPKFIALGNGRVFAAPILRATGIMAGMLSTDDGASFPTITADTPNPTEFIGALRQVIAVSPAAAATPTAPEKFGVVVAATREVTADPKQPIYYKAEGATMSWTQVATPVASGGDFPFLRHCRLSVYQPGRLMLRACDPSGPGVYIFFSKGDFSGWHRGRRITTLALPDDTILSTDDGLQNVGSARRPLPVNVAVPALYSNPVM